MPSPRSRKNDSNDNVYIQMSDRSDHNEKSPRRQESRQSSSSSDGRPAPNNAPVVIWSEMYDSDDDNDVEGFATYYMSSTQRNRMNDLSEEDKIVTQRLAMRRFHLPGKSWWEDWVSWFGNNHPIFCFTMADPRHPFGYKERCVNLVASLAFGLAATSMVMLYFFYEGLDMTKSLYTVQVWGKEANVSHGLVALLVIGGFGHVMFDLGIWFVQACPPCQPAGILAKHLPVSHQKFWLWLGSHIAIEITIISLALAVFVMCLRASVEDDGDARGITTGIEDYAFILAYLIECMATWFVLFPVITFILFTGILGCGRIPGIGGRPYHKWKYERYQEKKKAKALAEAQMHASGQASF